MMEIIADDHGSPVRVLIDDDDHAYLSQFRWFMSGGYPSARISGETRAMHRVLIRYMPGREVIDHADGDRLNNSKRNLRIATQAENGQNRGKTRRNKTGYKGVCYCRRTGKYVAQIMARGKYHFLGRFKTAEEAHAAYTSAAVAHHGAFAKVSQ